MIYREHDYEYLTNFYKKETKTLMERGFSNLMVVGFYKGALDNNAMLEKPYDLGGLEELMSRYLLKDQEWKW